jgi:SAM-dependent methyltransferase
MRSWVYDQLAEIYDERYSNEHCREENEQVAAWVREISADPVLLDVGCGTGLALELELASLEKYRGIDPSAGMLQRFQAKFPGVDVVNLGFEEAFDKDMLGEASVVISLFGSPSYIYPAFQKFLVAAAPHGLVMHYRPGYQPDYEPEIPTAQASFDSAGKAILDRGGRLFDYNNFRVGVW